MNRQQIQKYAPHAGIVLVILILGYCVFGVATGPKHLDTLVSDVAALQQSVGALNLTTAAFKAQLDGVSRNVSALTTNVATLTSNVSKVTEAAGKLALMVASVNTTATAANATAASALAAATAASAKATAAETTANTASAAAKDYKAAKAIAVEYRLRDGWNRLSVTTTWKNGQNEEIWVAKATIQEDAQKWRRVLDVQLPPVQTSEGLATFHDALEKVMNAHYANKGADFKPKEIRDRLTQELEQPLALRKRNFHFYVADPVPKENASTAQVVAVTTTGSSATVR